MKKLPPFFIILAMLLFSSAVNAQNSSIFEKYSEMKNVSSVYISKTMLEMDPNFRANNFYIAKVAGHLEAIYIVSTINSTIKNDMKKDIEAFVKKENYELLMKQKGNVSASSFYIKKKGDKIKELVMVTDNSGKINFVQLMGDFTLKDIQQITDHASHTVCMPIQIDIDKVHEKVSRKMRELDSKLSKKLNNIDLSYLDGIGL